MLLCTISRRQFIKYSSAFTTLLMSGFYPYKLEAEVYKNAEQHGNTFYAEDGTRIGELKGNTFIANDGTKIDVTHLGHRELNDEQKKALDQSAREFATVGFKQIGQFYENMRNRWEEDRELGQLVPAMNLLLHMTSSKEKGYHEYKSLFEEHKSYMIELADEMPNNPMILTETGASYDTIDVLTEGPHIEYFKETIVLLRKLPDQLRYQKGHKGLVEPNPDILEESGYANVVRGPPYKPITWDHELNVRGPPYDTAERFLEMALEDYPNNENFQNELIWVRKRT